MESRRTELRCFLFSLVSIVFYVGFSTAEATVDPAVVTILSCQKSCESICRGVAITPHTVLTAAHCLDGQYQSEIEIETRTGSVPVIKVKIHPEYGRFYRIPRNDVALLYVATPMPSSPLPIVLNHKLETGDTFFTFDLGTVKYPSQTIEARFTPMIVADLRLVLLSYLDLRRGKLPYPNVANEMEGRLSDHDPQLQERVEREFKGLVFSLYQNNRVSICKGDSGLPALVSYKGHLGVVGVASAITQMEAESNPKCSSGSTSIFTVLNQPEIVDFIVQNAPDVKIE